MYKNRFIQNIKNIYIRKFWKKTKSNYGVYDVVQPGQVSCGLPIPAHINTPPYYANGQPGPEPAQIDIKNACEIEKMRNSCKLASFVLSETSKHIKIGQTTDYLDKIAHEICIENNAYPSPLNYLNFPKSICTSVNNVACHGIPDDRPLKNGDLINIDVTVYLDGFHGDCSKTYAVGDLDEPGQNLIKTTEQILYEAIDLCRPGVHFCSIGNFIEHRVQQFGMNVIPSLLGHGIGSYFHGPPDIYHCGNNYPGQMKPGMTFTIEPAITQGAEDVLILEDGWTAVTADNARSAQCEHTILITDDGVEILTTIL